MPDEQGLLKKSTGLMTNLPEAVFDRHLLRRCPEDCRGDLPHVAIIGSARDKGGRWKRLSQHAQTYSEEFVDASVRCAKDVSDQDMRRAWALWHGCLAMEAEEPEQIPEAGVALTKVSGGSPGRAGL